MIGFIKAVFIGITIGSCISLVWNIQDLNYMLGTILGLVLIAGGFLLAHHELGKK